MIHHVRVFYRARPDFLSNCVQYMCNLQRTKGEIPLRPLLEKQNIEVLTTLKRDLWP